MLSQSSINPIGRQAPVPLGVNLLAPALILLKGEHATADGRSTQLLRRGGFAPWQEQRVTNHIEAHLGQTIRVADLAALSRLSVSYFSVAFRQSFGLSLQMFLVRRRVQRAQALMLSTDQPLSDIALACGFCDQPHFCRRFRRIAGSTPNAWRRAHRRLPPAA
jgi:AraC-like DNA-binding protein